MTHRLREAMRDGTLAPLGGAGGVIEADTTFIGGKEKNKHVGKRNARNIGGVGKQIVHTLVERQWSRALAPHSERQQRHAAPDLEKQARGHRSLFS